MLIDSSSCSGNVQVLYAGSKGFVVVKNLHTPVRRTDICPVIKFHAVFYAILTSIYFSQQVVLF
jgi:hypothetical protein